MKVQIHFSHPEKLVPRPRELSTSRNTLTSEKGRYAANKIFYLFAQHFAQLSTINAPWSEYLEQATKHSVFHFSSFSLL